MARPLVLQDQALMGGLQRDAVGPAKFQSLRQMQNLDVVQDPPALRVRNGYADLYSSSITGITAIENIHLASLDGAEYIFIVDKVSDTEWYIKRSLAAGTYNATTIYSVNSSTFPSEGINFVTIDNYVVFNGADQLYMANKSTSTDGAMPLDVPVIEGVGVVDDSATWRIKDTESTQGLVLNQTNDMLAITFQLPLNDIEASDSNRLSALIQGVKLGLRLTASGDDYSSVTGSIRVRLCQAGLSSPYQPDLSKVLGTSNYIAPSVMLGASGDSSTTYDSNLSSTVLRLFRFTFPDPIFLQRNSYYSIVLDYDPGYNTGITWAGSDDNSSIASSSSAVTAWVAEVSGSVVSWTQAAADTTLHFFAGTGNRLTPQTNAKRYVFTRYNSSLKIESAALDADDKLITTTGNASGGIIKFPTITAGVFGSDYIRVYRNVLQTSGTVEEVGTSVGPEYRWLGDVPIAQERFYDLITDDELNGNLSYNTNRRVPKDVDGNHLSFSSSAVFNERLFGANGKKLWFSQRLETETKSGQVGDSIYTSYPVDNNIDFEDSITAIETVTDGLLVFFKRNIKIITGGYSPLNPPPDLTIRDVTITDGTSSDELATSHNGQSIFLNQHNELKIIYPNGQLQEIADINQSLLSDLSISQVLAYKNQILAITDTDIYILDLSRTSPYWRSYQYKTTKWSDAETSYVDELDLKSLGVSSDELLICSDGNNLFKLDQSNVIDNGLSIPAIAETHEIQHSRRERWSKYYLEFNYHGASPTVTATATAKDGLTSGRSFKAAGSHDVRNHNGNLRVMSESCRFKVSWDASGPDELRLIGFE